MAEYTGQYMVAKFGGTKLTQLTRVSIEPKAAEPEFQDATHAEDSESQEVEGMAGAVRTRITIEAYDEQAGAHPLLDLDPNDTGSFEFFPEGTGTGKEKVTMSTVRFLGSPREFQFGTLTKVTAEFFAVGAPTYGTAP
jgi:hypothetical protein